MPKSTHELESLINRFVSDVEEIVHRSVVARLQNVLEELEETIGGKKAAPSRTTVVNSRAPRVCPVPGCGNPAAGPRYRWRCRGHGAPSATTVPAASPPEALSTPRITLPQPKTPALIPADVKITRLPPGPVPKERTTRGGPSVLCRLPGCNLKHSGPRYDLFCREHYAVLNAEERQKYKAMWKARHAA